MEITKHLPLSEEEQTMLDMHSFYNVLSVVTSLCYLIEFDIGIEGVLNENTKLIHNLKDGLKSRFQLIKNLKNYPEIKSAFFEQFEKTLKEHAEALSKKEIIEEKENMYSVFEVIDLRVNEMNKRLQNDGGWKVFNVEEIEDSFIQFFKAVEKNAKGKYRIIYEDTKQLPNDYLVHYNIISLNNETIFCHDKVIDIVRDLMANARKYTPFGGQIDASLTETETEIAFEVKDNGYGIPSDEIEKVVEFGYRASNMQAKKTMGGGFGLTKAYYFVKYNDGRFWIDSELNKGTTIKFVIPKP